MPVSGTSNIDLAERSMISYDIFVVNITATPRWFATRSVLAGYFCPISFSYLMYLLHSEIRIADWHSSWRDKYKPRFFQRSYLSHAFILLPYS